MHKPSPWTLVLFLMQMTKLKYGTKTYHSKVPLRTLNSQNKTWYNFNTNIHVCSSLRFERNSSVLNIMSYCVNVYSRWLRETIFALNCRLRVEQVYSESNDVDKDPLALDLRCLFASY